MPRGGNRSTSFKPGESGNSGGRPTKPQTVERRRVEADVRALARECAPDAIATPKGWHQIRNSTASATAPRPPLSIECGQPNRRITETALATS
jgi:hypothetical protein